MGLEKVNLRYILITLRTSVFSSHQLPIPDSLEIVLAWIGSRIGGRALRHILDWSESWASRPICRLYSSDRNKEEVKVVNGGGSIPAIQALSANLMGFSKEVDKQIMIFGKLVLSFSSRSILLMTPSRTSHWFSDKGRVHGMTMSLAPFLTWLGPNIGVAWSLRSRNVGWILKELRTLHISVFKHDF